MCSSKIKSLFILSKKRDRISWISNTMTTPFRLIFSFVFILTTAFLLLVEQNVFGINALSLYVPKQLILSQRNPNKITIVNFIMSWRIVTCLLTEYTLPTIDERFNIRNNYHLVQLLSNFNRNNVQSIDL